MPSPQLFCLVTMPKKKPASSFSLKDELFNRERVEYLAGLFAAADRGFNADAFIRGTMQKLLRLELKERIVHIASTLESHLDPDFKIAARQITAALPPPLDPTKTDDDFGDFIFAPLGEYVVRNGQAKPHVKLSLQTLKQITQRFSMEDAIRAFIRAHQEPTMATLATWANDKNYHVRRLVSEGTRPRLPWSGRLSLAVTEPLPLLDTLHADKTRYVTRSVANHLNDISKTDPDVVLKTLKKWQAAGQQDLEELRWMSKHALRTLVKQGDAAALKFLGFRPDPRIEIHDFKLQPQTVRAGAALEFSFGITAARNESLLVDYVIDFVKANGQHAPKVHKIKQIDLKKGETTEVRKRHPFRANATTFTLYPGVHRLTLQINGKQFETLEFTLRV